MEAVLVPLIVFGAIFGIFYVYFTTRNKERIALIEKNIDAKIFEQRSGRGGLKFGLLAIGVSLGVLFGQMIGHFTIMDTAPGTIAMIFLFGGIGLVLEHFMSKKEDKKQH